MIFFDKQKEKTVLIFDIGNGSVGVALAVLSKNERPKIITTLSELILFEEKPDAEKLQQMILKKLDQVTPLVITKGFNDQYFKNRSKKIKKVFCILSSPWYNSKGKTIVLSKEKKFIITNRFLEDILSKELKVFENEVGQSDENAGKKTTHLIESNFMATKVNGYVLENPIGQKTNNFETSIYISEAEGDFVNKISNMISKYSHINEGNIIFHSFPQVAFSTIRDIFPTISEYLYFDIAGEITDVAYVSGEMIRKMVSFPSGKNLITRRIAKCLRVPNEVARSFFNLYINKHIDIKTEGRIIEAIAEAEKEWNIYLNDALMSISADFFPKSPLTSGSIVESGIGVVLPRELGPSFPKNIFITAYPQTYEMFSSFIKIEKND